MTQDWRKKSCRMVNYPWRRVFSLWSSKQHAGSLLRPSGWWQCLCLWHDFLL